jgi:lipid-A-disaccharide synthase-like uncharacterized protein
MNTTPGILESLFGGAIPWLFKESIYWTCVGLLGNALFSSRFLIQWLMSERQRKVVVPPVFWRLSFWGSLISLAYAIHIDKLPVILSCAFLPFMYARNLRLLRNNSNDASASG